MDDASSDATPQIAAAYADRIRYVRQERNRGIYDNCNDGIALARGELIATFHADDVYEPNIVERQVDFLRKHAQAGAVFCKDILVDERGVEYARLELPSELRGGEPLDFPVILNSILEHKNRHLVCPTAMVRAAVYRELGGFRQHLFRNSADLDMWLRIARRYAIGILDEHLMRYRHATTQSSRRYHHLRIEPENYFRIVDEHLEGDGRRFARPAALAAYEAHRAQDLLMIAVNHYIRGELDAARKRLATVELGRLVASRRIQRARMATLWLLCGVLFRLPRIPQVAGVFYRRWHQPGPRLRMRRRLAARRWGVMRRGVSASIRR